MFPFSKIKSLIPGIYYCACNMKFIKVGGYNMNNIRYADDTVLIADNENKLQEMLDTDSSSRK